MSILTFSTEDSVILALFFVSITACELSLAAACLVSDDLDFLRAGFSPLYAASWAAFFELDRCFFAAEDILFIYFFYL